MHSLIHKKQSLQVKSLSQVNSNKTSLNQDIEAIILDETITNLHQA